MIHTKISSPSYATLCKKRRTSSGKTLIESAKSVRQHEKSFLTFDSEVPAPIRYADLYKREKAQVEMAYSFKKKKSYLVAPDTLIPNSALRTSFKTKDIKPMEVKAFQLRLDILQNLREQDLRNINDQDDDDWSEVLDPISGPKATQEKISKAGTVRAHEKDAPLDIFTRMLNEPWWKQPKEGKPNLRVMLMYLIEVVKVKQNDSYASACAYIVEIFRSSGIEATLVNQILDILLNNLLNDQHDALDQATIRTMAEFMIERKDIVVRLLEYTLSCEPTDKFRQDVINSIKFLTDVNSSDDIDAVLADLSLVHNAPDEYFSLKRIIEGIPGRAKPTQGNNGANNNDEIHPLLKKISEERWFPRGNFSITLDFVLDAIIEKLPTVTKTNLKTLTTHLAELNSVIGYSKEQFDRVAIAVISVLSHSDADYRLIAATTLVNLQKETKTIVIALLNSFLNDSRVLVRSECCESLKKLTGVMSERVLTDCANEISDLESLSDDDFSLQEYLKEKNRVQTPVTARSPPIPEYTTPLSADELIDDTTNIQIQEVENAHTCSPASPIVELAESFINDLSLQPPLTEPNQLRVASSLISSETLLEPTIRVEINDKRSSDASDTSKHRKERGSKRSRQTTVSNKTSSTEKLKSSSILPNSTNMWDSYAKQNESVEQKQSEVTPTNIVTDIDSSLIEHDEINEAVEKIIDENKSAVGYYRLLPNRRVLVPNKISMSGTLCDQTHIIAEQNESITGSRPNNLMNLFDLKNNQRRLNEVEFVQLLSSLVVRALQVHRQHEMLVPGSFSGNFANVLNISPMHIHAGSKIYRTNTNPSQKLPNLLHQRPTSRQLGQIQLSARKKAAKEGIDVTKAQSIEGALSNLLKTNRDQKKPITISSTLLQPSNSNQLDVTHAWLLIQLLKSQGAFDSENCLQKIIHAFPKFIPLLHTRIPQNLVPIIWNDPIIKQISSIFGNTQEIQTTVETSPTKLSGFKSPISDLDEEMSPSPIHYPTFITRDDTKKKFLPPIRTSKMNLPHHVLKFGFRELETSPTEPSDQSRGNLRRRRVYMHLMMSANENSDRNEPIKSHVRRVVKTYQTTTYMPIVSRAPVCS